MDYEIDARGLSCPLPVMETSKILDKVSKGRVTTVVDTTTARDNVTLLAKSRGWTVKIEAQEDEYRVIMTKGA